MKDIYILGIESSCDETSCSIVKNGNQEIETVILSQIDIHTLYGGVVPEIASRNHVKDIVFVVDKCLSNSNLTMDDIDGIAVAYGPGLVGSLLVGVEAAKTLAFVNKKPLIAVNHMIGHIYANNINSDMKFPLISLVISGGHTELIYMKKHLSFEYISGTLDDAVGECYDKVARVIGLGYPGGPKIDSLSKEGHHTYDLPIPMNDNSYNFSFSGLKSAVINLNHKLDQKGEAINKEDLCKSFQDVVVASLTSKTLNALKQYNCDNLVISGGVAANSGIREAFVKLAKEHNFNFSYPDIKYCTDNATMVAAAGYYLFKKGEFASLDLDVNSSLSLIDEKN